MPKTKSPKKADQYNDPKHNYLRYWDERRYEHDAEVLAIKRLLRGKHFKNAVDIGGGYGRLDPVLENYADEVTLAEPSQQQLDIAADFLKDHKNIKRKLMQADNLKFDDDSVELITMVRVMHHLPDPMAEFREIARVLSKKGYLILEVANNKHGRNQLKYFLKGKKFPEEPVDIRSEANKREDEIPFVNHNPQTVIKQLNDAGLEVERALSVSNLRSPLLKRIAPRILMLMAEDVMQPTLAWSYFGPSIFFLVKKSK